MERHSLSVGGVGSPYHHYFILFLPESPKALVKSTGIQIPKMKALQQMKSYTIIVIILTIIIIILVIKYKETICKNIYM